MPATTRDTLPTGDVRETDGPGRASPSSDGGASSVSVEAAASTGMPSTTTSAAKASDAASGDNGAAVNSWGLSGARYAEVLDETARYKAPRVALAAVVRDILEAHMPSLRWFLDCGTLLGAWRSGTMIPHDDDVDMGFYVPGATADDRTTVEELMRVMRAHLPAKYDCRLVDTYCLKVEVFEPAHGAIPLASERYGVDTDFHNVTVDLTAYVDVPSLPKGEWVHPVHINLQHVIMPARAIIGAAAGDKVAPAPRLRFEGEDFCVPADAELFLRSMYGYLGRGAVYDETTNLYRPGPKAPAEDTAGWDGGAWWRARQAQLREALGDAAPAESEPMEFGADVRGTLRLAAAVLAKQEAATKAMAAAAAAAATAPAGGAGSDASSGSDSDTASPSKPQRAASTRGQHVRAAKLPRDAQEPTEVTPAVAPTA